MKCNAQEELIKLCTALYKIHIIKCIFQNPNVFTSSFKTFLFGFARNHQFEIDNKLFSMFIPILKRSFQIFFSFFQNNAKLQSNKWRSSISNNLFLTPTRRREFYPNQIFKKRKIDNLTKLQIILFISLFFKCQMKFSTEMPKSGCHLVLMRHFVVFKKKKKCRR